MPQPAPTVDPATRSLPWSPLLEAVRQRQVRPCQRLLQQWVHRHGLTSLNDLCVELMQDQGEPALHWFLELMARDPSLSPRPVAALEPPAVDTAAVAATDESLRAKEWRHEHPVAAEASPPSQAPAPAPIAAPAAIVPPADSPQAGSPGARATAADQPTPLSASAQPGEASPVDGEAWQARAQAAVNDAFAALAESFPEVLPQTATSPVAGTTTAPLPPPPEPGEAQSPPSLAPEAPTPGESEPSPMSRPRGAEPAGEVPPPLPPAAVEAPMTPLAPPLPRVIPYPPSPIFPTAPGARLGSPTPQAPRARWIAAPLPAVINSPATAATDTSAAASAPPSAAGTPSATPPPPSAQPAPSTPPSAETWSPSLLAAPAHPGESSSQEPDTVETGSRTIPSLQALQQGFSQLGGRLARQGTTRLSHLRTLMRECVEETASLLRHPPEEQEPETAAPLPLPTATPSSPSRARAASAVSRSSGKAALPTAPLPSLENATAASRPRPVELSSDRARLKRAVVRAEVPGGRRAPAPSALSDLRAWLPDQSEDRRVS